LGLGGFAKILFVSILLTVDVLNFVLLIELIGLLPLALGLRSFFSFSIDSFMALNPDKLFLLGFSK
jgi:hypothetical protein